jgi:hypothetical protein
LKWHFAKFKVLKWHATNCPFFFTDPAPFKVLKWHFAKFKVLKWHVTNCPFFFTDPAPLEIHTISLIWIFNSVQPDRIPNFGLTSVIWKFYTLEASMDQVGSSSNRVIIILLLFLSDPNLIQIHLGQKIMIHTRPHRIMGQSDPTRVK